MSSMALSLTPNSTLSPFGSTQALQTISLPPLGNIDAYISAVNRIPLLTPEREQELGNRLKKDGDVNAAREMVMSHLRLVVSVARGYLGYGLPHADLIQEGNIGLMKAVKRFDPDRGVRLVSFAMHWVKAEMHEYILKNWRLVKVATTKAHRKLFFNLRSEKGDAHTLTPAAIEAMALKLNVREQDVIEMEMRLGGGDVMLESQTDDGEESYAPIAYLQASNAEPTEVLEAREKDQLHGEGITKALEALDPRARRIIETRWLRDDEEGSLTLHDLAAEYGVSAERIRQIEAQALKKMKGALVAA